MAKNSNQQRPRTPILKRGTSKVPLTFYRSGGNERVSAKSPFDKIVSGKKTAGRNFLARTLDGLVLLALIFLLAYSLMVASNPIVLLNSEVYRSKETYTYAVAGELQQLKNRTKLTFNDSQITRSLMEKFPEISTARIELPLFSQTPKVHITVASPSFKLVSGRGSYLVNSQGVAVAEAIKLPSINGLYSLTDETGFEVSPGQQVLSESNVSFINTLIKQSKQANVPISGLTLPPLAQELDLRTSDRPYFVKFHLGGDPVMQTGQFLASREQFDKSNTQPIEYLDVRVNGKIFYK